MQKAEDLRYQMRGNEGLRLGEGRKRSRLLILPLFFVISFSSFAFLLLMVLVYFLMFVTASILLTPIYFFTPFFFCSMRHIWVGFVMIFPIFF
ncbi:hypothetical protein EV426DRAFT_601342 [Tirmania nivea]|nr:hypothetical protein EV426DRAFT_601342 [Tirmania nivea]